MCWNEAAIIRLNVVADGVDVVVEVTMAIIVVEVGSGVRTVAAEEQEDGVVLHVETRVAEAPVVLVIPATSQRESPFLNLKLT